MESCSIRNLTDIIQAVLTSLAILVGGSWSYLLFVRRRQRYPRANLKHEITHRTIGDGFVLLRVTATVTNNGEVLLSLACAETRVQQVVPAPADLLGAAKKGKDPLAEGETEVEWPILFSRQSKWDKDEFQIEPGESDQILYDFVLKDDVTAVEVYTYLKNEEVKKREIGWNMTTIYDLAPPSQRE
jgi:hypothetical protein